MLNETKINEDNSVSPRDWREREMNQPNNRIREVSAMSMAEFAYKLDNPNGKFSEPPSMIYEMAEKQWKLWHIKQFTNKLLHQRDIEWKNKLQKLQNIDCPCDANDCERCEFIRDIINKMCK
jgi:hypothetical protein